MNEEQIDITTEIIQLLTPDQAWHYRIIPKSGINGSIEFYSSERSDVMSLIEELEVALDKKVSISNIPESKISEFLSKYYVRSEELINNDGERQDTTFSKNINDTNNNKDFLSSLIQEANSLNCSDIHIERYEASSRIRCRLDGKLFERYIFDQNDYPALINKIKILANLDIAEKRLPQDGRILYKNGNINNDIRVSVIPGLHGEKIVLRLLKNSSIDIGIGNLGFTPDQLNDYLESIKKPNGIILISGPTGSGKTTTLYATLNILNRKEVNILTIEDPVEYTLEGINQVQLKEDIGLTFERALKTFLRQDPDIIMVGEVRDSDTAQMAIRAALTGHLVFSTVHTNSAWGIISRLIDMGIPPFLLASTLNAAVAQRLVRKLCPDCKAEEAVEMEVLLNKYPELSGCRTHYIPKGCDRCHGSGYSGRIAVFEVINIDNELRESIRSLDINEDKKLKDKNIRTLAQSAIDVYKRGLTSFDEIYPILQSNF